MFTSGASVHYHTSNMWPQKVPSSPSVAEYIHLSIVSDGVLTDRVWRGLEMKTNGHGSKMRVAYTLTSDSLHTGVGVKYNTTYLIFHQIY